MLVRAVGRVGRDPGQLGDGFFLAAATSTGHRPVADWFTGRSPDLFWPADRSWCAGTEVDFDSTPVAGSQALVDAVLTAPGLEARAVDSGDAVGVGGDAVTV